MHRKKKMKQASVKKEKKLYIELIQQMEIIGNNKKMKINLTRVNSKMHKTNYAEQLTF